MTPSLVIESLGKSHDRSQFQCGVPVLDRYLREQASQDVRRRTSACFVALEPPGFVVAGYYTLAAGGVPLMDLPQDVVKRLPRYPSVPVARVGRLAVDQRYRGRKLGAALLWDAGMRASRSEVAAYSLVVDAKDETAAGFYLHHGFIPLRNQPLQLFLPLETFLKA